MIPRYQLHLKKQRKKSDCRVYEGQYFFCARLAAQFFDQGTGKRSKPGNVCQSNSQTRIKRLR